MIVRSIPHVGTCSHLERVLCQHDLVDQEGGQLIEVAKTSPLEFEK
jgi:hypothetical protein